MIGKTRVGLKYLVWGMVIGVLFAPRSGKETRSRAIDKAAALVSRLIGSI